jgi:hypothetical protein
LARERQVDNRQPAAQTGGMPLDIHRDAPTMLVRRDAWERSGLTRAAIDQLFNLTPDEFRVESGMIAIGPIFDDAHVELLIAAFENAGLVYFEEFFELTGNWPEWLTVFAQAR